MRCPFISVYLGVKFFPFLWNTKVPCKDHLTLVAHQLKIWIIKTMCVENKWSF